MGGFTELSPTDYQLDGLGFPCNKGPSIPNSPVRGEPGGRGYQVTHGTLERTCKKSLNFREWIIWA